MGLSKYYEKRDFKKTAEPRGHKHKAKQRGGAFIVQKHDASRLHYDFRIEMEGVLRSWAVPKGPSLDPKDKRLAVQVEDHPMEYGAFEGIIPAGQYGGGTVMLWDHGTWIPKGNAVADWKKGMLKFTLTGKKLRGDWTLLRLRGRDGEDDDRNWLLVKERDEFAKASDDYSITEKLNKSVTTGRDLDQIAKGTASRKKSGKGGMNVWQSNHTAKEEKVTLPKKTSASSGKSSRGTSRTGKQDIAEISGARKAAMPESIKPQLATLVKSAPSGDQWVHEIKFDGYRALCFLNTGRVHLVTRNGNDWTARFGPVAEAASAIPAKTAILDGEVVLPGDNGATDFQALQNALGTGRDNELLYYAFDILYLDGYDLTGCSLLDRKEALKQLLGRMKGKAAAKLRFSEHFQEEGAKVLKSACGMHLEGIISKLRDARYVQTRSESWVKTKCIQRQEFVIGGYTPPEGGRGHFGALLVGVHEGKASGMIRYAGKVGTGFSNKSLEEMAKRLRPLQQKETPFTNPPREAWTRRVQWVKPVLVGEVEFTEMTTDGRLRHPSFQGLREDKAAKEVIAERAAPVAKVTKAAKARSVSAVKSRSGVKRSVRKKSTTAKMTATSPATTKTGKTRTVSSKEEARVLGIRISSPDKILYPEQGITKLDLARYYESVAEAMMPLVQHRPLTLVRCPAGRGTPCFYQRHSGKDIPEGIEPVRTVEKGKPNIYLAASSIEGILSFVQMGTLEFHAWGAKNPDVDSPDQITIDLDPDPEAGWPATVLAAKRVKEMLEGAGFVPFLKTTGGKGLHIVIPLKTGATWDEVRQFSEAVANALVAQFPDEYVATMSKAKRKGKIFIDYLRNVREASAIAPYSTRAREGAPVSCPIAWSELSARLDPQKLTVKTVPARLTKKGNPWKDFEKARRLLNVEKLLGRLS